MTYIDYEIDEDIKKRVDKDIKKRIEAMNEPTADEMLDWMERRMVQLTSQAGITWYMSFYDSNSKASNVEEGTIKDCVTKAMKEEG